MIAVNIFLGIIPAWQGNQFIDPRDFLMVFVPLVHLKNKIGKAIWNLQKHELAAISVLTFH